MPTEVTIKAYKFNELDGRAKEKAHATLSDWITQHDWWDCIFDDAKREGEAKGFHIEDIRFSGFWSQGDGANWLGRIDLIAFLHDNLDERSAWYGEDVILLELWEQGWIDRFVTIENNSYRYEHSGGMRISEPPNIEMEYMDNNDTAVLTHGVMEGASVMDLYNSFDCVQRVNDWCDEALQKAREYADEIYKRLEEEHTGLVSEESLIDFAEGNGYLFNEDGGVL